MRIFRKQQLPHGFSAVVQQVYQKQQPSLITISLRSILWLTKCRSLLTRWVSILFPENPPSVPLAQSNISEPDDWLCSLRKIVRLCYLPLFHAAMVPLTHVSLLRSDYVTFIMRRFEIEPFLSSIQKYRITELMIVPPVALATIKHPLVRNYSFESVKMAVSGAGPLHTDHRNTLQEIMGAQTAVNQGWGMTETSCIASRFYLPELDDTGSIGRMFLIWMLSEKNRPPIIVSTFPKDKLTQ